MPRSRAIIGSDVVMTVPSTFSINRAQATMSGTKSSGRMLGQSFRPNSL